jgi:hypothetical protein
LDTTRHTPSSQRTTHNKEEMQELGIGQRWSMTWSALFNDAPRAWKLSQNPTLLVFTLHCLVPHVPWSD